MEDFKAILGIVKAVGADVMMELAKSKITKICLGLSLLAWTMQFDMPHILIALALVMK